MRPSAGLAASLFLTVLSLAGCGHGTVIGGGPQPTASPITPSVTNEYVIPTASSKPGGITVGRDNFLYFTEQNTGKIGQVTTGGTFQEFVIASKGGTAGNNPIGITSGPDGNLWFTEQGTAPGVAMMALAGEAITEYHVPGSSPAFITSGPATNTLVFTDPGNNAIGEALTSGTFLPTGTIAPPPNCTVSAANVCEFSITGLGGTASADPLGIATNSSDALHVYFAENTASKIGILDVVHGTLTEVSTLTSAAGPTSIIQGPDGAMWFTENTVAKMGRMTTSGQMTEYPLSPAKSASGLVAGIDNNLYFGDAVQNSIGRISAITPTNVNEYTIPTANAFPGQLVVGPDGRIYFTEVNGNKIGQLNY